VAIVRKLTVLYLSYFTETDFYWQLLLCDSCVHGTLNCVNYEQNVTFSWTSSRRLCMTCVRQQNSAMTIQQLI